MIGKGHGKSVAHLLFYNLMNLSRGDKIDLMLTQIITKEVNFMLPFRLLDHQYCIKVMPMRFVNDSIVLEVDILHFGNSKAQTFVFTIDFMICLDVAIMIHFASILQIQLTPF